MYLSHGATSSSSILFYIVHIGCRSAISHRWNPIWLDPVAICSAVARNIHPFHPILVILSVLVLIAFDQRSVLFRYWGSIAHFYTYHDPLHVCCCCHCLWGAILSASPVNVMARGRKGMTYFPARSPVKTQAVSAFIFHANWTISLVDLALSDC